MDKRGKSPAYSGSSPHTRDKWRRNRKGRCLMRIIPAYAGQISEIQIGDTVVRDHPRIRGTNTTETQTMRPHQGSSPHTRDKFKTTKEKSFYKRIIPAYAGQIISFSIGSAHSWDHPRIRGTNFSIPAFKHFTSGSSPHTRDKS